MKKFIKTNNRIFRVILSVLSSVGAVCAVRFGVTVWVQILLLILCVTFFALPMIVQAEFIKHYEVVSVKRLILNDLLFTLCPAIIPAVVTDLICESIQTDAGYFSGIGAIIFCITSVLITAIFWVVYAFTDAWYKPE